MNKKNIKLVVIQKAFASYRKGIFDKLNSRYDFKVIHSKLDLGLDETQTDYSVIVGKIKYAPKSTAIYLFSLIPIFRLKPHVVVHEFTPSILSLFAIFLFRKAIGYKIILWGHIFRQSKGINEKSAKYFVRSWMIKSADAVLFYSNESKEMVANLIPSNKYFVAQNALDTTKFDKIYLEFEKKGVDSIKLELGITYNKVIVFIGRLLEEKLLTEAFISIATEISKKYTNIGFYIIGDGPERIKIESKIEEMNIKNIHLLGSIYDDVKSSKYLYVSDLMLMPGAVGLAVNHALAFRTPTVTFESSKYGPFHGPEYSLIDNFITGYRAKNFDNTDLVGFIENYFNHPDLQTNMKISIGETLQQNTSIDSMEQGFVDAIDFCLK